MRGRRVATLGSVVAVVALTLGGTTASFGCLPAPYVKVSPDAGPAGSNVAVTGENFGDGPVYVHWNKIDGPVLASARGPNFQVTVVVPATDPGIYYVIASQPPEGTHAAAPFEVKPPPPTTTTTTTTTAPATTTAPETSTTTAVAAGTGSGTALDASNGEAAAAPAPKATSTASQATAKVPGPATSTTVTNVAQTASTVPPSLAPSPTPGASALAALAEQGTTTTLPVRSVPTERAAARGSGEGDGPPWSLALASLAAGGAVWGVRRRHRRLDHDSAGSTG